MPATGALPSPLVDALAAAAGLAAEAVDPWWIIGSAAVALHGVDTAIADLDLSTSARDAGAMLVSADRWPDTTSDRSGFRSLYGRLPSPDLPIEVTGDLEVRRYGAWRRVEPSTRHAIDMGGATLFVPDRAELAAIPALVRATEGSGACRAA